VNEAERTSALGNGAAADDLPSPSTLRSPRPARAADSGTFPPLTAPITVRLRRRDHGAGEPPGARRDSSRPPSSFPHRLAAPAFGALLSGVLTYCLHQCAVSTPAQGRLVRARTTYAAAGVVAEPVRFEYELAAGDGPTRVEAPVARVRAPATPAAAAARAPAETQSGIPVVRPIDLRAAPDARPTRTDGAAAKRARSRLARGTSARALTHR
jgi:hypothetical protein